MTIPLENSQRMRLNLQVQSLVFLSWVFLSTEKAYSSFPRLKNLELILFINTPLLHVLNPRPSLYNISAKNHLNCLKSLLFESLFLWVFVAILGCGSIFDQRLLLDYKQLSRAEKRLRMRQTRRLSLISIVWSMKSMAMNAAVPRQCLVTRWNWQTQFVNVFSQRKFSDMLKGF